MANYQTVIMKIKSIKACTERSRSVECKSSKLFSILHSKLAGKMNKARISLFALEIDLIVELEFSILPHNILSAICVCYRVIENGRRSYQKRVKSRHKVPN
jgi:hypothetical protein